MHDIRLTSFSLLSPLSSPLDISSYCFYFHSYTSSFEVPVHLPTIPPSSIPPLHLPKTPPSPQQSTDRSHHTFTTYLVSLKTTVASPSVSSNISVSPPLSGYSNLRSFYFIIYTNRKDGIGNNGSYVLKNRERRGWKW